MKKRYLAIIGATASGKSALAMKLAESLDGELINCDSVQIYKDFDIGSAKPSTKDLENIPHHLIDIRHGTEEYDARTFASDAESAVEAITLRKKIPILVGGTGLYLRALWQDGFHDLPKSQELREELKLLSAEDLRKRLVLLDPKRAAEIHENDRFRLQRAVEVASLLGHSVKDLPPPVSKRDEAFVIYMDVDRRVLQGRIIERSKAMLSQGLIEEVRSLLEQGLDPAIKPMQSIGYREVALYLKGELKQEDLEQAIVIATRQYAKRQETLFRKIPKDFIWNENSQLDQLLHQIRSSF